MVYRTRCTVYSAPYTVYSRVVVGAIYAYMCTYSYRTQCTVHGELTCGGGGNICIHVYLQLPYTVNSRVVVGAIYTYMCTYSYRTRCTVHGELTCGGGIHVWELLTCAGDIHVWELLTCETSHQSEILHSLIFVIVCSGGYISNNGNAKRRVNKIGAMVNASGKSIHSHPLLHRSLSQPPHTYIYV